jgi:integration host factor subunit beta
MPAAARRRRGASVPTMTKADLVDEVAKVSNLTKKETELIVNTVFDSIASALAKVEKVELRGFGSFRVRRRNARRGRNPKTGSGVSVPEKRVPFFKVGKRLKELVNA